MLADGRVDLVAQLHHSVDVEDAVRRMKAKVSGIANVLASPAPDVEILQFTEFGPVLAVRPYTHTDSYWQVYFDTNRAIAAVAAEAGFPMVERTVKVLPTANGGARTRRCAASPAPEGRRSSARGGPRSRCARRSLAQTLHLRGAQNGPADRHGACW